MKILSKQGESRKKNQRRECEKETTHCTFYPPFATSLLFVQMPNGLLHETPRIHTCLVYSVRAQLQAIS